MTLSASSIVSALKDMEKNPFSMNNAVPVMRGQAMVDNSTLRMTGSLERTANMGEREAATRRESGNVMKVGVKTQQHGSSSVERKLPLDAYSRSSDFHNALLRVSLSTEGGEMGADAVKVSSDGSRIQKHQQSQPGRFHVETEQLAGALNKQKEDTYSKIKKIEKKEVALFQNTIDLVPAHLLVKHGMFDMIKGKQLDKIMKLLFKMRLQLLAQGIHLWHSQAQKLSIARFGASAITVHRVARGFLGRRKVKRRYQELLKREKAKNKVNAIAMMNRDFKATMIQACIRRYLAVQVVKRERLHKKSIITVQMFYKQWKYKGKAKSTFELFIRSHYGAKKIQRVWRGSQGRKIAHKQRVLRHRTEHQNRFETTEGVFEIYFEQHGAAIVIQKWYNNLPFINESKARVRAAKRTKQLHVRAVKIQKVVRLFLMNKKMMLKWEEKKLKAKYNIRPRQFMRIIKTQAAMRRFLVQRRNATLFAGILEKRQKRKMALELGIVPHHRKAHRFEHLKIGDLRNIVRLERKALIIQKWYKASRVLGFFYGMIKNRRQLIIERIQRWYRTWQYRRELKVALYYIQPMWKKAVKKYLVRKYAQISISRKYKSYRAMKWFRDWRRMKARMATKIQTLVIRYFKRREVKAALASARYASELKDSGQQLFEKTNIYNLIDEVCLYFTLS